MTAELQNNQDSWQMKQPRVATTLVCAIAEGAKKDIFSTVQT
jgi:hypothetical protein